MLPFDPSGFVGSFELARPQRPDGKLLLMGAANSRNVRFLQPLPAPNDSEQFTVRQYFHRDVAALYYLRALTVQTVRDLLDVALLCFLGTLTWVNGGSASGLHESRIRSHQHFSFWGDTMRRTNKQIAAAAL